MPPLFQMIYDRITHYSWGTYIGLHILTFVVGYLIILRLRMGSWVITPKNLLKNLTKRERKLQKKMERSRKKVKKTRKEKALAFWRWLWCKCYEEEQKGEYFSVFEVWNDAYLITYFAVLILLILSLVIIPLRPYTEVFFMIRLNTEVFSWLIYLIIVAACRTLSNRKRT